jgi:hypothetical protein
VRLSIGRLLLGRGRVSNLLRMLTRPLLGAGRIGRLLRALVRPLAGS